MNDFKFLQSQIDAKGIEHGRNYATPKVCIPSPTMAYFRYEQSNSVFHWRIGFYFKRWKSQYRHSQLPRAGARFVQLDDTNLAYLCDEKMRADVVARNDDPTTLPRTYAQLINAAISKRPADMKIGIHLCRGNYRSQWFASGGYELVAEVLFKELNVDVYFLEYDDARSGDFAPLRFLPENKVVVLGLLSSKQRTLDDKKTIMKRLKKAATFCPKGLDQLCLNHQCGFSSTQEGNELSEEEQWAKVRLEVEIAKEMWGENLSK